MMKIYFSFDLSHDDGCLDAIKTVLLYKDATLLYTYMHTYSLNDSFIIHILLVNNFDNMH